VGIVVVVDIITKLGRGSWGVGHGSEWAKRNCMTGRVRLKDISIRGSGAAGGGCCGAAMQKCSMRARVWPPRSARLPFRASSLSQENNIAKQYRYRAPGISYIARAGCPEGLPGRLRCLLPPSLCLRHFSAPNASPDTLTPTCLPTSMSEGHSRRTQPPPRLRRTVTFFFFFFPFL